MAQYLEFFPRQIYISDSGAPTSGIYSDVFDIADAKTLYLQGQIFQRSAALTGSVTVEHAADSSLTGWVTLTSFSITGTTGALCSGTAAGIPQRFVRAKLVVTAATSPQYVMLNFVGRAFC